MYILNSTKAKAQKRIKLNKKQQHLFLKLLLWNFFNTINNTIYRFYSNYLFTFILSFSDKILKITAIGLFSIKAGNENPIENNVLINKLESDFISILSFELYFLIS